MNAFIFSYNNLSFSTSALVLLSSLTAGTFQRHPSSSVLGETWEKILPYLNSLCKRMGKWDFLSLYYFLWNVHNSPLISPEHCYRNNFEFDFFYSQQVQLWYRHVLKKSVNMCVVKWARDVLWRLLHYYFCTVMCSIVILIELQEYNSGPQ